MALVVPNQGEEFALSYLVNKHTPSDLTLRLNTNNITPGETDTEASYTEVSGSGYSIALTGSGWSITQGAPSEASFAQQTFTFSGSAGNIYGAYLTRDEDDKLTLAEKFSDGPYNVSVSGQTIKVTPKITAS